MISERTTSLGRPTLIIRTGGQTGVDRAALDAAIDLGIGYAGWCPRGGWAEDCPNAPGLLARYPHLVQTPSADPRQRTAWNVRDSDATLIVTRADAARSEGTEFTRTCAEVIFVRPLFIAPVDDPQSPRRISAWLATRRSREPATLILDVAGPRESEAPGITAAASSVLRSALERYLTSAN